MLMRAWNQPQLLNISAKWHHWTIQTWFQLVTLLSIDFSCFRLIKTSIFGTLETCYLLVFGWDEFVQWQFRL